MGPVHYIDEGQGPPIIFLHGNPDWSFRYHKITLGLKDRFRGIAVFPKEILASGGWLSQVRKATTNEKMAVSPVMAHTVVPT